MSANSLYAQRPSLKNPRFVRGLLVSSLVALVSLCLMSAIQKSVVGMNPFMPRGYVIPILVGGGAGGIIWTLHCRSRFQLLENIRIEKDSEIYLKLAHEELARLGTAVEQAGESLVITDLEGTIEYVNPAFTQVTGYTASEVRGKNPRILKSGKHSVKFYKEMWTTLTSGNTWRGNLTNTRKNGLLFHEYATITPLKRNGNEIYGYVAVKRDITQQIEMEQQLFRSQKMEIMGRLSGQIAHDFRNMLTVILAQSDLIQHDETLSEQIRMNVRQILEAANRANQLTQNLLAFSRGQDEPELQRIKIIEHLQNIESLLKTALGNKITFEIRNECGDICALLDISSFDRILVNLAVNARDAMPKGGTFQIFLSVGDDLETVDLVDQQTGPTKYLRLSIRDTGTGMTSDVAERAFEPFYTTKERGKGTGLGLATVDSLVRQQGGHIKLETYAGKGTTFHIYLPQMDSEDSVEQKTA